MIYTERVKNRLIKRGRPVRGESVNSIRFSLTVPVADNKQLEIMAAMMGTNRHALSAALVTYGLELLKAELLDRGDELPDALWMVR